MAIQVTTSVRTSEQMRAIVVTEIRRRVLRITNEMHRCTTNAQRNIALARQSELRTLADFFEQIAIEPGE